MLDARSVGVILFMLAKTPSDFQVSAGLSLFSGGGTTIQLSDTKRRLLDLARPKPARPNHEQAHGLEAQDRVAPADATEQPKGAAREDPP